MIDRCVIESTWTHKGIQLAKTSLFCNPHFYPCGRHGFANAHGPSPQSIGVLYHTVCLCSIRFKSFQWFTVSNVQDRILQAELSSTTLNGDDELKQLHLFHLNTFHVNKWPLSSISWLQWRYITSYLLCLVTTFKTMQSSRDLIFSLFPVREKRTGDLGFNYLVGQWWWGSGQFLALYRAGTGSNLMVMPLSYYFNISKYLEIRVTNLFKWIHW